MAGVTAIELAGDACLLADVSAHHGGVRVHNTDLFDRTVLAGEAFPAALKQLRTARKFPARARVVLWEMPAGSRLSDPVLRAHLQPIKAAGFRIERVVDPCQALTELAKRRPSAGDATIAWLAIDRSAVAIVVARGGQSLYSRLFTWDSSLGAVGSQARLLQRYSLVAHLAPEIRRAIASATTSHDARVDAIVTCGNLPDLRSLTMPLIEELDVEVETLDSLDGFEAPAAIRDRVGELAPALRLATAAALAPRPAGTTRSAALAAAAIVVAVAGGWYLYAQQHAAQSPPVAKPASWSARPPASVQSTPRPAPPPQTVATAQPTTPPPQTQPKAQPTPPQPGANPSPAVPPSVATAGKPPSTPPRVPSTPPPASSTPSNPAVKSAAPPADKPHAVAPAPPEPLTDPVPMVNTILVSAERRFAIINGRVVAVGDTVGPRVVTAIEPREIVLQEPSGVQIRVGLGGRLVGVVRPKSR